MATASELKILAIERLEEAELLFLTKYYRGAYYLAGYAVELGLKAVACQKLNVEIFDKRKVPTHIAKSFMIHDLSNLLILSGLSRQLELKTQQDAAFAKDWSKVVDWSEQRRYDFTCRQSTVKQFIISVKKVMQWIKQHW
nr:HEPN domain-containing protein [uncultured Dyadobacter sp.]